MDVIDIASEQEAVMLAAQIQQASKSYNKLVPKGTCHYCDEDVPSDRLFCNRDCSQDYDKEQMLRKRLGKTDG